MIFPGMDPYLEDRLLWPGVHSRLVVYLADQLQSRLGTRYVTAVEERVYIEITERRIIPDISVRRRPSESALQATAVAEVDEPVVVCAEQTEVREPYIAILDLQTGQSIVTVIEVVSPTNKSPGPGQNSYQEKQQEVLNSGSHLVEIDLIRRGSHILAVPSELASGRGEYDYLICVNRASDHRKTFDLYPRKLRQRLPRIRVPLVEGDPDVPLDIQAGVEQVYTAGHYADRIDYSKPCRPPLGEADQVWANELISAWKQKG